MDQALSAGRSSRTPNNVPSTSTSTSTSTAPKKKQKLNKHKSTPSDQRVMAMVNPTTTASSALSAPLTASRKRPLSSLTPSSPSLTHVIGTCHTLEKDYYRLTTAPDPSNVRPLPILKKALEHVKQKWLDAHDYTYACTQLKSIRQDLVVQHVKDDFVVSVYECHGRIALESGDFDEFAQCQTQLKQLYEEGYKGHVDEFGAYAILHACHSGRHCHLDTITMIQNIQAQQQKQQLATTAAKHKKAAPSPRSSLIISPRASTPSTPTSTSTSSSTFPSPAIDPSPCITHALAVRHSLITRNYHSFFRLYLTAPNMSSYLMDRTCEQQRKYALRVMAASYRPTITVQHAMEVLAFDTLDDTMEFLAQQHAVSTTIDDEICIDMKATAAALAAADAQAAAEAAAARARGVADEKESWSGQPGSTIQFGSKKRKKPSIAQIEAQYQSMANASYDDYDPAARKAIQQQMKKAKQMMKKKKKKNR